MSQLILATQSTAPSAPSTGKVTVYVDGNGDLCWKDASGNITKLAAAGSYTLTLNSSGTLALGGFTLTLTSDSTLALNGNTLTVTGGSPTITGAGTLATGGFTLTVPATGTAALYATNTWTPVLKFGATTVTGVTINNATYATIGPMCYAQAQITLTGKNGTGTTTITGLPVTPYATGLWSVTFSYFANMAAGVSSLHGYTGGGATTINLLKSTGAASLTFMADTDFTTSTALIFSTMYRTA